MRLLAGTQYDPAAAVTKNTTALLAMTAFDTTNLRLVITAPASGIVRWRGVCAVHGATTLPSVLLGVLEGATVRSRLAPMVGGGNLIATGRYQLEATGLITGLTPGNNYTFDFAYGVEVIVASTGIKYGGPNNTTTNDAYGGIVFELWDITESAGGLDAAGVRSAVGLASANLDTQLSAIDTVVDAVLVDTAVIGSTGQGLTSLATQASVNTVDTVVDAIKLKTDNLPADPADASDILGAISTLEDFVDTEVGAIKTVTDKLDTALVLDGAVYQFTANALELAPSGGGGGLDAAGVRAAIGLASANLDTQLAALPTAAEIVAAIDADSVDLDAIGTIVTGLDARIDVVLSTRLASAGYTAPDNTGIAAIQAKTDGINFTVAGHLDVNLLYVNGVLLTGTGVDGVDDWRRA